VLAIFGDGDGHDANDLKDLDAAMKKADLPWSYKIETKAGRDFEVGERLHVIPSHVCAAVNLHEYVYGRRGDRVEEVWKVEGRGKLQ